MAKIKLLVFLLMLMAAASLNANKVSAVTAYETCIDSGGSPEECKDYPGAPADTDTCNAQCTGNNAHFATSCDSKTEFGMSTCPDVPGKEYCCFTAPATSGTVVDGNGCYKDSECASNNCSMVGSDYNSELGSGTCRAVGSTTTNDTTALPGEGTADSTSGLTGNGIEIPKNTGLPDPSGGIKQILTNLLTWLLGIVGIIALIGFVISGIQYIISTGDDTRMETAKKNMTYSIIGIIVALAGFVIVQAIDFALRGMSF